MADREDLADYVKRVRAERGLSLLDVERRSARTGQRIAGSYVNRIENRIAHRPSHDRLIALCRGLGVPEEELLAVASGRTPQKKEEAEEMKLLIFFRELTPDQKRDALRILEALRRGPHEGRAESKGIDGRKKSRRRVA